MPPHLYTVATLPWEIQKSHFQQYCSYILQIIYVISKQNKLLCLPPYPPHLKKSSHYLAKCTTFSFDWKYVAFLQTLVALKKASCGLALVALKRNGCDVWQMECQASNITANVQSDHLLHGYIFPVLNLHWSTVSSTMLCWNSAHVATRCFRNSSVLRIGTQCAWKMKTM